MSTLSRKYFDKLEKKVKLKTCLVVRVRGLISSEYLRFKIAASKYQKIQAWVSTTSSNFTKRRPLKVSDRLANLDFRQINYRCLWFFQVYSWLDYLFWNVRLKEKSLVEKKIPCNGKRRNFLFFTIKLIFRVWWGRRTWRRWSITYLVNSYRNI